MHVRPVERHVAPTVADGGEVNVLQSLVVLFHVVPAQVQNDMAQEATVGQLA
jgi:hypothetical protein